MKSSVWPSKSRRGIAKREGLASQVAGMESREAAAQERIAECNTEMEGLRQRRDGANNSLTEVKVTLASQEQLHGSLQHQLRAQEQRIRELSILVTQRRNETATMLERRGKLQSEMADSMHKIESLKHDHEIVNQRMGNLIGEKATHEQNLTGREEILRDRRRHHAETQQQRGTIEVELAQKRDGHAESARTHPAKVSGESGRYSD